MKQILANLNKKIPFLSQQKCDDKSMLSKGSYHLRVNDHVIFILSRIKQRWQKDIYPYPEEIIYFQDGNK